MKKIILLAAILLAQNVEANEKFFIVNCGRDEIVLPLRSFPLGVPFSYSEICACSRRNWRGLECNKDIKNRILLEEFYRKNLNISNSILEGIEE